MKIAETAKPYEWDSENKRGTGKAINRFSIKIFQWMPSRSGVRRGTTQCLLRGRSDLPDSIIASAQAFIDDKNKLTIPDGPVEP